MNIGTLAFFLKQNHHKQRPHGRNEAGPKDIVIEKLKLNDEQIATYNQLIVEHQLAIRENDSLMMATRHELYNQLMNQDQTEIDIQLNAVAKLQKQVEIVHFQHFQKLKSLCSEDQLSDFEELAEEMAALFNGVRPPHGQRPPPPRH
ncbi:MAG: hypothetical protein K9G41_05275 [Flavobacteriales bacterium]|nr:hypothetical protein [Flavobacteriales bacterium]